MASYFNLGTADAPRWINLANMKKISAKKLELPGNSEVYLQSGPDKDEIVRGASADRLIAYLAADPDLKRIAGV